MRNVRVKFTSEQRDSASDALRALGITSYVGGWYPFDDVQHDNTASLTQLTLGDDVFIVPTRHILLVVQEGAKS